MKKPAPKKPSQKKAAGAKAETPIAEWIINQTEMAAVLGVTTRHLRDMTAEGVVEKTGAGYRVSTTVRAYADWLKAGATKHTTSNSLDALREEKAQEIRLNRMRKDRDLITLEEAIGVLDEVTGMFVSSLVGLPAQITGVPRERQRLDDIFDIERQRLADRLSQKITALREGRETSDPEAEDDAG